MADRPEHVRIAGIVDDVQHNVVIAGVNSVRRQKADTGSPHLQSYFRVLRPFWKLCALTLPVVLSKVIQSSSQASLCCIYTS